MGQERRKYSRIAFQASATLIFPDQTFGVSIFDLSLKGALVRLPAGITIAEQAACELRVKLEMFAEITMEARIVHVEGRYAGLLFLTMDLDSVTHLRRLVELNLGDQALFDRELSELIDE
ncbi:cyclic diguanosine monophosphate-binding protein [Betaproteobacteria bacterium]|nr:cyclic diguanosine monophosphate-binding protein [Betaproteobacteria bacterium]